MASNYWGSNPRSAKHRLLKERVCVCKVHRNQLSLTNSTSSFLPQFSRLYIGMPFGYSIKDLQKK
uniref:Uncharacterized protein n=1 Tax=Vitis vinifera TaxID=29760 RepID=F6H9D2_VITVI